MMCTLQNVKLSYVPLRDAMLCTDCEFVSADEESGCPVCGSGSRLRLPELLDGESGSSAPCLKMQEVLEGPGLHSSSATNRRC